jgi:hypothetical protein
LQQHYDQHDTPFFMLTFSASKHKKRGAQSGLWWAKTIKRTMMPVCPGSQDYKEQIPKGLSQQAMAGPTAALNVTTGAWNQAAKI